MNKLKIPISYKNKIINIKNTKMNYSTLEQQDLLNIYNSTNSAEIILALGLEAFSRLFNIEIYDVQLYSALLMSEGKIVEMKTGEGKSFVSILVALVKQKTGKVYIVTINDTLAVRDLESGKPIFDYFNISSTAAVYYPNYKFDPAVYLNHIVFSSVSRLIFDFLYDKDNFIFNNVIIDEIDYILIDNANSQFSVSKQSLFPFDNKTFPYNEYWLTKNIKNDLKGEFLPYITDDFITLQNQSFDYYYLDDYHTIFFTYAGLNKIKSLAELNNVKEYKDFYFALFYTLQADKQYINNRDYIVENNKIVLINKNNGRLMHNSQKETGLQIALEIKENCPLSQKNESNESISMQLFFLLFPFITGMSGTVDLASNEFKSNFKKKTSIVPTNLPVQRIDMKDNKFILKKDKFIYALDIINLYPNHPFLIVLENEQETIELSEFLMAEKINFKTLNNHNINEENDIIANFETQNQIVVTTNLLGRGTDIKITAFAEQHNGLIVILLDKFKNKRIENQIKGRCGRQGKKGVSYCVFALDDLFFYSIEKKYLKKIKKHFLTSYSNKLISVMQNHLLLQEESQRYSILEIDKMLYSFFYKLEFEYITNTQNNKKILKHQTKDIISEYNKFVDINNQNVSEKLFKIILKEVILTTKENLYKQILDISLSMNLSILKENKTDYMFIDYIYPAMVDYKRKVITETISFMLLLEKAEPTQDK